MLVSARPRRHSGNAMIKAWRGGSGTANTGQYGTADAEATGAVTGARCPAVDGGRPWWSVADESSTWYRRGAQHVPLNGPLGGCGNGAFHHASLPFSKLSGARGSANTGEGFPHTRTYPGPRGAVHADSEQWSSAAPFTRQTYYGITLTLRLAPCFCHVKQRTLLNR